MKLMFTVLVVLILVVIVFIESGTWEVKTVKEERGEATYHVQKHTLHWDRFLKYIKETPVNILKKFSYEKDE